MRTEIDSNLLAAGYLTGPHGGVRFIYGLEELGQHARDLGASLYWEDRMSAIWAGAVGLCYLTERRILLQPYVFTFEPETLRKVIEHELLHCTVGRNEEQVLSCWDMPDAVRAFRWPM